MKVSCLMPTYNRGHRIEVVEEALFSFLAQDYEDRELILCNDCPEQELVFDHPLVRVLNVPRRFPDLCSKLRYMIEQSTGDAFCRWDDDDICLSHRIGLSVEMLGKSEEWRPANYWMSLDSMPQNLVLSEVHQPANSHVMSIWTRRALEMIGGYPTDMSLGEDQAFNSMLQDAGIGRIEPIPRALMFYYYRWGTGTIHLSGNASPNFWTDIGRVTATPGVIHLDPHWARDYAGQIRLAV